MLVFCSDEAFLLCVPWGQHETEVQPQREPEPDLPAIHQTPVQGAEPSPSGQSLSPLSPPSRSSVRFARCRPSLLG